MNENRLVSKSEKSNFITVIIILGIILLSWFIYLTYINFQPKVVYEERTKIFLISFLILCILYCFFYLLNIKRFFIFDQYFEIRNFFGTKKYYYSNFKTYFSNKVDGRYNSYTKYYLITKTDEKITIVDSEYSNFHSFFYDISKKIKIDKKLNVELDKSNFSKIAIVCFLISIFFFFISSDTYNYKSISEKDIVYISDVLQENVKLKKGSKGSKTMEIHLKNFPIFTFKDSGYNEYLMNNFSKGDTIKIGIASEVFKKKIEHTLPLSFKEKYLNYSTIFIEQFKTKEGNDYYNLVSENNRKKANSFFGVIVFSIFGSIFLILSIFILVKPKSFS